MKKVKCKHCRIENVPCNRKRQAGEETKQVEESLKKNKMIGQDARKARAV
jgi:hypothetical protein